MWRVCILSLASGRRETLFISCPALPSAVPRRFVTTACSATICSLTTDGATHGIIAVSFRWFKPWPLLPFTRGMAWKNVFLTFWCGGQPSLSLVHASSLQSIGFVVGVGAYAHLLPLPAACIFTLTPPVSLPASAAPYNNATAVPLPRVCMPYQHSTANSGVSYDCHAAGRTPYAVRRGMWAVSCRCLLVANGDAGVYPFTPCLANLRPAWACYGLSRGTFRTAYTSMFFFPFRVYRTRADGGYLISWTLDACGGGVLSRVGGLRAFTACYARLRHVRGAVC